MSRYCEDYPCCGHTNLDPCPGRGDAIMISEMTEDEIYDFLESQEDEDYDEDE